MKLVTALFALAFASQAHAYGQLSYEDVVVQQVSCDYRPVEISMQHYGRVDRFEMLQNLVPMTIEGLEVTTRSNGERRVGTRHQIQLSINSIKNSFLSTTASVTDDTHVKSPNGNTIQRTYLIQAASIREQLIADKIAGCQELARAAKSKAILVAPMLVSRRNQVKVIRAPYDPSNRTEDFDSSALVFEIPMGEKLKSFIREHASCVSEMDGVGFSRAHLADGTPVESCLLTK